MNLSRRNSRRSRCPSGLAVTGADAQRPPLDRAQGGTDLGRGDEPIESSGRDPNNAFVAVEYRGAWFYISDSDLNSKTTFALLGYLFSLQSGSRQTFQPTLTLPVGN